MPFKKRHIPNRHVSKRHRCRCQPKIPLREMTTRNGVWNWTAWHRSCISARRALRARKAFSASWCERPVTARGDRINRKTRRFVRVPPRICRNAHGHRSKPPSAVTAPDTYVYLHRHNKLPYVQGVATLPIVYFNERYWSGRRNRCVRATKMGHANFHNWSKIREALRRAQT